ncbi:BgTH12-04745 [Blumeria graminis f. sp. triticale]|uniref:Bgt-2011 n=3 Tax=Blumeria graminis TaxID=34373 RepID=A0A061HM81_BLUGR|nr:hypothetical protein BGT96224_2011 [Blumeria graminis f. sp. tritici 96224]CAD6499093.1 BgTH12-04745 [Blumeria graminis f. sp. triticale]VCU39229.1 Bgt-2011 [Blumeria graminis f. sp. tritici]
MSLLGRLLSSTSSSPNIIPDSYLEDQFTFNLLYPEPEALCHKDQIFQLTSGTTTHHGAMNNFDLNPDYDLEIRDIRVIIMQEATANTGSAYLLYDSHAPRNAITVNSAITGASGNNSICPTSSNCKPSAQKISRSVGIKSQNSCGARAPIHYSHVGPEAARNISSESSSQQYTREYQDEVTAFSNCIFGNSDILAYKGPGTKVHVLPSRDRSSLVPNSLASERASSLKRSSFQTSRLANSSTPEKVLSPLSAGLSSPSTLIKVPSKKILITRMFPVRLQKETVSQTENKNLRIASGSNFTSRKLSDSQSKALNRSHCLQPKPTKTPMYAVGLVIRPPTSVFPMTHVSRSGLRSLGSLTDNESFPSSFDSEQRSGCSILGYDHGLESVDFLASSNVDGRIDIVAQHWDIITRTLSDLQAVATLSLLPMLRQTLAGHSNLRKEFQYFGNRTPRSATNETKELINFQAPRVNSKNIQLTANCLMQTEKLQKAVEASRQRIVTGIKARQVITGQGRWGIWRDQARVINRWAGGKDQSFFFFNLLTAFLGNHTDWLQALGPRCYRQRYVKKQRAVKDDHMNLPSRTVIISNNKVVARRLAFLLSSFLPPRNILGRHQRPRSSVSPDASLESPTRLTSKPILTKDSKNGSHNFADAGITDHPQSRIYPNILTQYSSRLDFCKQSERDAQFTTSNRTANLPIPGSHLGARKSTTSTASTATPITTIPYFSTRRYARNSKSFLNTENNGSLAADDLLRLNQRRTIPDLENNQAPGWGNVISGLWSSSKRACSNPTNSQVTPFISSLDIQNSQKIINLQRKNQGTERKTATNIGFPKNDINRHTTRDSNRSSIVMTISNDASAQMPLEEETEGKNRVLYSPGAYESSVKTSFNKEDGVIDIEVPLPDYLGLETNVSSPSSSGYQSTPDLDNHMESFEHSFPTDLDPNTNLNVGGWLPQFCPDFTVQAVPNYDELIDEIKDSLRSEPTPSSVSHKVQGWATISSAIIADSTNFTIKRILYRRLIQAQPTIHETSKTGYCQFNESHLSTNQTSLAEDQEDGCFIEEPIVSMDPKLTEAVEKITAQSGHSNILFEGAPGSTTRRKNCLNRSPPEIVSPGLCEVPRNECKHIVLGALEQIVKEVAEDKNSGGSGNEVDNFLRRSVRNWLSNLDQED